MGASGAARHCGQTKFLRAHPGLRGSAGPRPRSSPSPRRRAGRQPLEHPVPGDAVILAVEGNAVSNPIRSPSAAFCSQTEQRHRQGDPADDAVDRKIAGHLEPGGFGRRAGAREGQLRVARGIEEIGRAQMGVAVVVVGRNRGRLTPISTLNAPVPLGRRMVAEKSRNRPGTGVTKWRTEKPTALWSRSERSSGPPARAAPGRDRARWGKNRRRRG